ncbi:MAG: M18 family aminopeptidase [Oscillospiraceae bacterium]
MNDISGLLSFIERSPSTFHVIDNMASQLSAQGFIRLYEQESWKLEGGKNYFVCRNNSSIIAFKLPCDDFLGFNIVASHSDSPTFKIKENAQVTINDEYVTLNTERYGGMIMSTWLDRPLSVAGRVMIKNGSNYLQKLVNVDKDLLIIPNLAIHMDKTVNDGKKFNPQVDMLPLFGDITSKNTFMNLIAQAAGVQENEIISTDLFLYNRQKGTLLGANEEYIGCGRLDDLQCAYSSAQGFISAEVGKSVAVLAIFDNEEVGSGTKQGAASTLLFDILTRINAGFGRTNEDYLRSLANSFMISADNAHALHPNQPSVSDPTNKPYINKGIVIKYNANQKYTSDAVSSAIFKGILQDMGIKYQSFTNRSDLLGGSTLGNISNTNVSINTVDIGLPQLAMHSAFETAGVNDTLDFIKVCEKFYSLTIKKCDDEHYVVE